jgi:ketosteroid isomerase-like protein
MFPRSWLRAPDEAHRRESAAWSLGVSIAWASMGSAARLIGAIVVLVCLSACGRSESSEQRLRATIEALDAAIEQRDSAAVSELLAEDFVGPDGLDRQGARRLAVATFMRYRDLGVTLGPLELKTTSGHATARFSAALTGGSGRMLPDAARLYEVETGWREEDGEWKMTSAQWSARL